MQKLPVSAKKAGAIYLHGRYLSRHTVLRSRMPLEYGAEKPQSSWLLRTPCALSEVPS